MPLPPLPPNLDLLPPRDLPPENQPPALDTLISALEFRAHPEVGLDASWVQEFAPQDVRVQAIYSELRASHLSMGRCRIVMSEINGYLQSHLEVIQEVTKLLGDLKGPCRSFRGQISSRRAALQKLVARENRQYNRLQSKLHELYREEAAKRMGEAIRDAAIEKLTPQ